MGRWFLLSCPSPAFLELVDQEFSRYLRYFIRPLIKGNSDGGTAKAALLDYKDGRFGSAEATSIAIGLQVLTAFELNAGVVWEEVGSEKWGLCCGSVDMISRARLVEPGPDAIIIVVNVTQIIGAEPQLQAAASGGVADPAGAVLC